MAAAVGATSIFQGDASTDSGAGGSTASTAVMDFQIDAVSVLLNPGGGILVGSLVSVGDYIMAASPSAIVAGDLNGDGNPDLVVTEQATSS